MINHSRILEITDGSATLKKELLTLFKETLESVLQRLEAGADWQKTVHELKGAAANMGAEELHKICQEIEHKSLDSAEKQTFFDTLNKHITFIHTLIT